MMSFGREVLLATGVVQQGHTQVLISSVPAGASVVINFLAPSGYYASTIYAITLDITPNAWSSTVFSGPNVFFSGQVTADVVRIPQFTYLELLPGTASGAVVTNISGGPLPFRGNIWNWNMLKQENVRAVNHFFRRLFYNQPDPVPKTINLD